MATTKITELQALNEHNSQYLEIRKKFPLGDIEFSYEHCFLLDGSNPDMTSPITYATSCYSKWGVSLQGKQGKKKINILLRQANDPVTNIPSVILEYFEKIYAEREEDRIRKDIKKANMDSILKVSGKTIIPAVIKDAFVSFMDKISGGRPPSPSLTELKMIKPEIYEEYLQKADGTKLVFFEPLHPESDQWGFNVYDVYGAYKPLKKTDDRIRIIFNTHSKIFSCVLFSEDNRTNDVIDFWISLQSSIIDKFDKASEGSKFKGWKNATEYKLSQSEIAPLITRRIFETNLIFG